MRIERNTTWAGLAAGAVWAPPRSGRCPYVGIAIGADSDEGEVLVNGHRLVSGRPMPLEEYQYKLSRAHPVGQFSSVAVLEVMLFERHEELGAALARAPKLYSSPLGGVNVASDAAFTSLLTVPYVHRERARVTVRTAAALPGLVRVSGRFWSAARNAMQTVILREEIAEVQDDDTVSEFSYVIGGTDQAEHWTELEVAGQLSAGGAAELFTCDVLVSGEAAR